jgi:hypothetical protein
MCYYNKELEGQERFLKYLSRYIKGDEKDVDWLINVFMIFKKEAEYKSANQLFGGWYRELCSD